MTKKAIDLEIPFFFKNDTGIGVKLRPEFFYGEGYFLRFDLYPKAAPKIHSRHYGFWDIPLSELSPAPVVIKLNWENRKLLFVDRNGRTRNANGIFHPLDEHGYAILHASVWKQSGTGTATREYTFPYTVYLEKSTGDSSPRLKQLNIPVTDRCNLSCVMCPRHNAADLLAEDCSVTVIERIMADVSDLVAVLLQGMGEPLLYPGMAGLIRRFKAATHPDAIIGTTSNATLLDERKAIELCEAGIDFIYFSVDGADKKTYEAIRVGANYEQVIANIARMIDMRRKYRPELRTMLNYVIQPANLSQIPDIARLAAGLGIDHLTYSYDQFPDTGDLNTFGAVLLEEAFAGAENAVAGTQLSLGIPPVRKVNDAHCLFLECVCILRDGRVLPCHAMAPGYCPMVRYRDFGSLTKRSLSDVWSDPEFVSFRNDVLRQRYPFNCRGCYCLEYLVP